MFQISILNASNQSIYATKMLTRLYVIDKIQHIIFSLSRNYSTKLLLNISNQFMRQTCWPSSMTLIKFNILFSSSRNDFNNYISYQYFQSINASEMLIRVQEIDKSQHITFIITKLLKYIRFKHLQSI